MSQFANLINSITDGSNLSLLSSMAEPVKEQIKTALGGRFENLPEASPQTLNDVSNIIEQKAPVLSDSISSMSKTFRWRNVIIIGLLLWAVFVILMRIFIPDEKVKEHVEKTNDLLFGGVGIFPLIGMIWLGTLLIVTVVPAILATTPKFENVLSGLNSLIQSVPQNLLSVVAK